MERGEKRGGEGKEEWPPTARTKSSGCARNDSLWAFSGSSLNSYLIIPLFVMTELIILKAGEGTEMLPWLTKCMLCSGSWKEGRRVPVTSEQNKTKQSNQQTKQTDKQTNKQTKQAFLALKSE